MSPDTRVGLAESWPQNIGTLSALREGNVWIYGLGTILTVSEGAPSGDRKLAPAENPTGREMKPRKPLLGKVKGWGVVLATGHPVIYYDTKGEFGHLYYFELQKDSGRAVREVDPSKQTIFLTYPDREYIFVPVTRSRDGTRQGGVLVVERPDLVTAYKRQLINGWLC